ncbi:hypothetical protein Bca4012_100904 [Brassica carinata]
MLKWACPTHLRPSPFNFRVHIKSIYLTILNGLRRVCPLSLFFTSLPPFILSRDSRDSRVFYFFFFTLSSSCFLVSYNQGFTDICKGVSKIATKAEIKSEMDYDTVHTMALLEAQREYMDMNDEDAEFDIDEEMAETETEAEAEVQCEPQAIASTQAAKPQRKRRKTSLVWKDFKISLMKMKMLERKQVIMEWSLQHQKIDMFAGTKILVDVQEGKE